jgi:hypothetical protein
MVSPPVARLIDEPAMVPDFVIAKQAGQQGHRLQRKGRVDEAFLPLQCIYPLPQFRHVGPIESS